MILHNIAFHSHTLELGNHTAVMGIVNVTPDSFSDGGHFYDCEAAVAHAIELWQDGADIIDIGGESTRPYSKPVSAEQESRRVLPVIEKLVDRISIPISIDTTKAEVARLAIAAGAAMINDISALRLDPDMAAVAAESRVPVVLMHMQGTPKTMQKSPIYSDLLTEIHDFLKNAIENARTNGIANDKIIIDPGIGFGKTFEHNLMLIHRLKAFQSLGVPILVGPSRKAFIRNLMSYGNAADLGPTHPRVEQGNQAAIAAAVLNGAHIVRVHDVAGTRATLEMIDALKKVDINHPLDQKLSSKG